LGAVQINLSKKEDGKGSQFVAVDVPKGLGLAPKGSTSLENYASACALVSVVVELLVKPSITRDKIAVVGATGKRFILIPLYLSEGRPNLSTL